MKSVKEEVRGAFPRSGLDEYLVLFGLDGDCIDVISALADFSGFVRMMKRPGFGRGFVFFLRLVFRFGSLFGFSSGTS